MTRPMEPPGTASECRSCKALIVWTRTTTGKNMPMDLTPSDAGDFYLFRRDDCIAAVHAKGKDPRAAKAMARGDKRYTSHFATCPSADQHRRKA